MDAVLPIASAPRRLWRRFRRLRQRCRARKALAHIDRGLQYLRAQGVQVPQEVVDARWRVARVVRQQELDRRLVEVENVVADLKDAGLTVRAWQVGASLKETSFGFSSDLDIHVYVPHDQAQEAARVASRLSRHWWREGQGQLVNVIPRVGPVRLGTALSNGSDMVYGAAQC